MKRSHLLFLAVPLSIYILASCLQFALASTSAVLLPYKDGNYKEFKPSSGSIHYTLVDETLCNGTTDYNFVTSTNSGKRREDLLGYSPSFADRLAKDSVKDSVEGILLNSSASSPAQVNLQTAALRPFRTTGRMMSKVMPHLWPK